MLCERPGDDRFGFARRHESPERARDLETQIGSGRGEVLAGGLALRTGCTLQRVRAAAGVHRPLEIEPRPEVIWNVGINDAGRETRHRDAELLDVIGPRIPRRQRHQRPRGRTPALFRGFGSFLPRLQFGEPLAVFDAASDRRVERQSLDGSARGSGLPGLLRGGARGHRNHNNNQH